MFKKWSAALAAAGILGLAQGNASAVGVSEFAEEQPIFIDSTGYWQVLVYRFKTEESRVSSVFSGNSELAFIQRTGEWFGVYLYDYTTAEFTHSQAIRTDVIN